MEYSPVSFYTPLTVEDQFRLLGGYEGNYLMDFRLTGNLSSALVSSMCSYVYEGVPITKISSDFSQDYAKFYNNAILAKTLTDKNGKLKSHTWNTAAFQGIYSDLIIESTLEVAAGKKLELYWQVINANYVEIDPSGNITGLSPLLEFQISKWKSEGRNKVVTNFDLFGTENIVGYGYTSTPTVPPGGYSLDTFGTCSVNFTGKKVTFNSGGVPAGVVRVPIFANDANIDNPVVGLKTKFEPLNIYLQGGSQSSTSVNTSPSELKVTSKPANGPLQGTGKPGWLVVVTFPGGVVRTVVADSRGYWAVAYPSAPLSPELIAEILVSQTENTDVNFSSSSYSPPIVQTIYGVPILKLKERLTPNTLYGIYFKNLIQKFQEDYKFSKGVVGGYIKFIKGSDNYLLSGLYIGRSLTSSESDLKKQFLSYPGAIVQETGVEVFYSYRLTDAVSVTPPKLNTLYTEALLSVSAGPAPLQTFVNSWVLAFEIEKLTDYKQRFKLRYDVVADSTYDRYILRWESNAEIQTLISKYSLYWEVEYLEIFQEEYSIKYEIDLPEDRLHRDFYRLSWDKDLVNLQTTLYKLGYELEQTRSRVQQWSLSWESEELDSILIKPYYVKKFDESLGILVDCISYQVFGDLKEIEKYLEEGSFKFYFSNPPTYSLISFNIAKQPYNDTFIETLNYPQLQDRSGIPQRFTSIGNYTIRDININNSLSLNVLGRDIQLNEYKSHWVSLELDRQDFTVLPDGKSLIKPIDDTFRNDLHIDVVELDVEFLIDTKECCFTQNSVGTRCSPY